MNDKNIITECVEDIVREVLQRTDVPRRRVSFAPSTKASDGIKKERDRILVRWFKDNVKGEWRRGFNYCSLTPSQIHNLKQDTVKLIERWQSHPQRCVTVLPNAAGGTLPLITDKYMTTYMIHEINYMHAVFR